MSSLIRTSSKLLPRIKSYRRASISQTNVAYKNCVVVENNALT
jgi:hypothetical protein